MVAPSVWIKPLSVAPVEEEEAEEDSEADVGATTLLVAAEDMEAEVGTVSSSSLSYQHQH